MRGSRRPGANRRGLRGFGVRRAAGAATLVDPALATVTRTGEAAAYDTRTGLFLATPWPSTDVARLFSDGAIIIEGARTNLALRSEALDDAAWSNSAAGVTTTADAGDAPDGGADADQVNSTSGARRVRRQLIDIAESTAYTPSIFVKRAGASDQGAAMSFKPLDTATQYVDVTAGAAWQRIATTFSSGTGSNPSQIGVSNNGTNAASLLAWGAQLEVGGFASTPIRTAGATATRNAEECTLANASIGAALFTGAWTVTLWPEYASGAAPTTAYALFFDADNYLALVSGTTLRLRAGGANHDITGLSYVANAELAIAVDFAASMVLTGGGGGTVALTDDWSAAAAMDLTIGSDATPANHLFGVISRVEAA